MQRYRTVIPSRRNWTIIFYNNEVQLRHEIWPEIRGSIKEEKAEAYILAGGFKVVSDNDFVICYVRSIPEEAIIVICSTDEETREVNIPVNIFGIHYFNITEDLFHNKLQYEYSGTSLTMKVPPHRSYIFCVPCQ